MVLTAEIIKWTFIVLMSAPLPILLLSSLYDSVKQKVQNRYTEQKNRPRE